MFKKLIGLTAGAEATLTAIRAIRGDETKDEKIKLIVKSGLYFGVAYICLKD